MTPAMPSPATGAATGSSKPADPVIARHEVGIQLRKLREARSLRLDQVAAHLGIAPSSVSRIETGQAPTKASYLKLMLDTAATQIRRYSGQALPDLLQTRAYATAFFRVTRPDLHAGQVAKLVTLLLHRQKLLHRTDHRVHVVIDEPALFHPLAPAPILTGQLRHLLALSDSSSLTLQVISPGAEAPILSPPFTLLGFPGRGRPDMGCYYGPAGQIAFTRRSADVQAMHAAFDALTHIALPPAATASFIRDLARR